MDERRKYRGGFVWPIILIGAGIVFLLNNLGMLGWNIWDTLLRLWPVVLIAIGLDILVGRRFPVGSVLLGLALVVVLVLAVQGTLPSTTSVSSLTVDRTDSISEDIQGAERASVEIGFGAGTLNLGALSAGSPKLIEGSLDLSRNEHLNKSYSVNNGVARLVLNSRGSWSMGPEFLGDSNKTWDLRLNGDVPLELRIDTGASKSTLDLAGLSLRRFDLKGGVGQVTVKLPVQGQYPVSIDGGVGQVVIIIPEGLAARVRTDGGLGGVSAEGNFQKNGDTYTTGDYNTAQNRTDVRVNGGIGQIVLRSLSE